MRKNLLLPSVLLFFFCCLAPSAEAEFIDISRSDAELDILYLAEKGIISTINEDGSQKLLFHPKKFITRVEFLKLSLIAFGYENEAKKVNVREYSFLDTEADEWYSQYVAYAKKKDIVRGYDGNLFLPEKSISRAEAIKLLTLISRIKTDSDGEVLFVDVPRRAWFFHFVDRLESQCILKTDTLFFRPNDLLTREDMATYVRRILFIRDEGGLCEEESEVVVELVIGEEMETVEINNISEEDVATEDEELVDQEKESEEGWATFTREIFGYSFSLPELWWWAESSGEDETIVQIEAGLEEDITDENKTATISIVDQVIPEYTFIKEDGEVTISLPRDENTSFRVSGFVVYEDELETIARSISVTDAEEAEEAEESPEFSVRLSDDNPVYSKIPNNATNVPVLKLVFQAPEEEDVLIQQVSITRTGLGNVEDIRAVKLFEGFVHKGRKQSFGKDDHRATIRLVRDPLLIPKGQEKEFIIAADFSAEAGGGQHAFSIQKQEDIIAIGGTSGKVIPAEGSFPISSKKTNTSDISSGSISVSFNHPASVIRTGLMQQELAKVTISEEESIENVLLKALTISFDGIQDGDLKNLSLAFRGETLSQNVETTANREATFVINGEYIDGLPINQSRQKTLTIIGDVYGGATDAFQVSIDDVTTDIIAVGEDSGFYFPIEGE